MSAGHMANTLARGRRRESGGGMSAGNAQTAHWAAGIGRARDMGAAGLGTAAERVLNSHPTHSTSYTNL